MGSEIKIGVLVLGLIANMACFDEMKKGEPDLQELGLVIADVLLRPGLDLNSRTIIVDRSGLDGLPILARKNLERRLDEEKPGWLALNIVGHFDEMPGEWIETKEHGRINTTHLFVTFKVELRGSEALLKYMRAYCATCGAGGDLALSWDGTRWLEEELINRRL